MGTNKPIILFDGYCNLCSGTINFIQKKDRKKLFQYVTLHSKKGKEIIEKYRISSSLDSVIFIYRDRAFAKSDAITEIAGLISYPWRIIAAGKFIPKRWRNFLYDFIAGNRYKWFGKKEVCDFPDSNS